MLPLLERQKETASLSILSCFLEKAHSRKRHSRDDTHCDGSVFGTILSDMVDFCELDSMKRSTPFVIRKFVAFLSPIADSLETISGVDVMFLKRGLASRHMCNKQSGMIKTRRLATRDGRSTTVIGATAAIYLIYSIAVDPLLGVSKEIIDRDAEFLVRTDSLTSTCRYALNLLQNLLPCCGYAAAIGMERIALDAERRAIERAVRGVRVAKKLGKRFDLPCVRRIKLELEFFKRAVWPEHEHLDSGSHDRILTLVDQESFFVDAQKKATRAVVNAAAIQDRSVIPLSEFNSVRLTGDIGSTASSFSIATSISSLSSGSDCSKHV